MEFNGFNQEQEIGELVPEAFPEREAFKGLDESLKPLIPRAETALYYAKEQEIKKQELSDAIVKLKDLKNAVIGLNEALAKVALNKTATIIVTQGSGLRTGWDANLIKLMRDLDNACTSHGLVAKGRADKGIEREIVSELVDGYKQIFNKLPPKTKSGSFREFVKSVGREAGLEIGDHLIDAAINKHKKQCLPN